MKLHKLIITKLDGTSLDWFRFWNQFESEIDKAEIDPVSKFSYLKEFLESEITYWRPPFYIWKLFKGKIHITW